MPPPPGAFHLRGWMDTAFRDWGDIVPKHIASGTLALIDRLQHPGDGLCHGDIHPEKCRSVEAAEHDAEAPVERHLAEHLRRRHAGGEDGPDRPRLLLAELRRETFLEQFYDLTWRPGVDVRRAALVDLLPE
jgi:hypothetical protein